MEANQRETRSQAWNQKPPKPIEHTQRKKLSKRGAENTPKGGATRDASSNERCTEMKEQIENERRNEISKPWNRPQVMKESLEARSPKIRS
ncbi:hypothetical protein F2Q69_00057320 [Brassica cretica]|uniref:Uncharacterized protein n=1 Tax=Brassica cretica TaxID=69181 RepID=A0A8S9MLQ8_BRACR|nr:hypothetical protein F2Q69_00057320 [Brassica cretica]